MEGAVYGSESALEVRAGNYNDPMSDSMKNTAPAVLANIIELSKQVTSFHCAIVLNL
jgi:hypothetical protein